MSGVLSSELMEKFTDRFGTLDKLAEAKDSDIMNIMGNAISEPTLKVIKATLEDYYTQLIYLDTLTGMPSSVIPSKRIAWGRLIDASGTYSASISELKKGLEKKKKKQRKFICLRYGINKKHKNYSYARISEKLDMPVCELDEFEVKSLNNFTEHVLSSRK